MNLAASLHWIVGNLVLAFIPVALAFVIARGLRGDLGRARIRWGVWLPLLVVWLIFLPNSCYLLTEWRHYLGLIHRFSVYTPIYERGQYAVGPTADLLRTTLFFLLYTNLGLLAFCWAVLPLRRLAWERWGRAVLPVQAVVFLLCALGVFLGLVLRFNSWDLAHPGRALAILTVAWQTLARPILLAAVLLFGAFLWLLYAAFEIWLEGLAARRRSARLEKMPHAPA